MENYLLSLSAIAKVAGIDQGDEALMLEFQEKLFVELNKLAEQTRGSILDQLCLQDRGKNPSYFLPEANGRFASAWSTLEGRLSIASGKDIISLVNSWIRNEYHKSSSRSRIISALTPDDISPEIKGVIDQLLE